MINTERKRMFNENDIEEIIKKLKPTIEYGLLQTTPENRDDLRQHLYEMCIQTLKNLKLNEPRGLFY